MCGRSGALNQSWLAETSARIGHLQAQAAELTTASLVAEESTRTARLLVGPVPRVLAEGAALGVATESAGLAWSEWSSLPEASPAPSGLRNLAAHFTRTHPSLLAALDAVTTAANREFEARQDRWAPVATALSAWCSTERAARKARSDVKRMKRVEQWVKEANDDLRNARLRPFAEGTAALWSELRQESNVELLTMTLTGSATRRAVDFEVRVDDRTAPGLGVMSQGEVNALALSVFLPRATSDDSPLRFVVIDDPVQAMDPSKVDGMARVFAETARTRQVLVFTHDDRLPAAIRQLGLPARIVQVTRQPGSVVEIQPAGDPCLQLLAEGGALAAHDRVPGVVAARVVPGLCREAIESACFEATRRRRLGRGDRHEDVEAALSDTTRLRPRLAMAIFDDPSRGAEVYRWLSQRIGSWAADAVRTANEGSHGTTSLDAGNLVGDTRRLVAALRERLP